MLIRPQLKRRPVLAFKQGDRYLLPQGHTRIGQCPQGARTRHGGLLDQLVGKLLQVLELGMEASGERVHRAAVGVVGGVGDELIVEAEARVA